MSKNLRYTEGAPLTYGENICHKGKFTNLQYGNREKLCSKKVLE